MSAIVPSFAFIAALGATGFLLLRLVAARDRSYPAEYWMAASLGLGIVANAFFSTAWMVAIGPIPAWSLWIPAALFAAANAALHPRLAPLGAFGGLRSLELPAPPLRALHLLALGAIALFAATFYFNAISYPMASYDGRAIWLFKAHILFEERTALGDAFLGHYRAHYHPNYPLLVPLTTFRMFDAIGRFDPDAVRFLYTTLFVLFGLWMFHHLAEGGSRLGAAVAVALYMGLPFRHNWVEWDAGALNSAEADFPLSFLATASFLCWDAWWRTRATSDAALGALFAGGAAMAKAEGIIVLAVLAGAHALQWLLAPDRRARIAPLAAGLAATLLLWAPWLLLARHLPNFYDEDFAASLRSSDALKAPLRLPIIGWYFAGEFANREHWGLAWIAFALALPFVAAAAWRTRDTFLPSAVLAWLCAFVVVYSVSPLDLNFHLNTSIRRLVSQVFPLAYFVLARHVLAEILQRKGPPCPTPTD